MYFEGIYFLKVEKVLIYFLTKFVKHPVYLVEIYDSYARNQY